MIRAAFFWIALLLPSVCSAHPILLRHGGPTSARRVALTVSLPAEWQGHWAYQDSSWDCDGALVDTQSGIDSLCAGMPLVVTDPNDVLTFTCSTSADPTVIDLDCIGTAPGICDVHVHVHGVRSGDSFTMVFTVDAASPECVDVVCSRQVEHAVRIDNLCVTATRNETWGRVKQLYR